MELDINSCRQLLSITCHFNQATEEYGVFWCNTFIHICLCLYPILSWKLSGLNLIRNEQMFLRHLNYLEVHENTKMNRRGGSINSVERLKSEF